MEAAPETEAPHEGEDGGVPIWTGADTCLRSTSLGSPARAYETDVQHRPEARATHTRRMFGARDRAEQLTDNKQYTPARSQHQKKGHYSTHHTATFGASTQHRSTTSEGGLIRPKRTPNDRSENDLENADFSFIFASKPEN